MGGKEQAVSFEHLSVGKRASVASQETRTQIAEDVAFELEANRGVAQEEQEADRDQDQHDCPGDEPTLADFVSITVRPFPRVAITGSPGFQSTVWAERRSLPLPGAMALRASPPRFHEVDRVTVLPATPEARVSPDRKDVLATRALEIARRISHEGKPRLHDAIGWGVPGCPTLLPRARCAPIQSA